MSQTLSLGAEELSEGSVIQHTTLGQQQTVVEIAEETIRTVCDDSEFVYPRAQLACELSAGRFEILQSA